MINRNQDEMIRLPDVSRLLGCHYMTPRKWWRYGLQGVRLQTWVIGGRRFTTRRALEEFTRQTRAKRTPYHFTARQQAVEPDGAQREPQTGETAAAN